MEDIGWIEQAFIALASLFPPDSILGNPAIIRGLFAVILVCIVCGAVGSLVVGNRMAFFSDALAHSAFAGVALGLLTGLVTGALRQRGFFTHVGIPLIMVGFGVLVGIGIVYVRERTTLASDTVIGVFFAGAIGFGAMLIQAIGSNSFLSPESFLFGSPATVVPEDFVSLLVLTVVTLITLVWLYNSLVLSSFNASLARSRQIPLRLFNYLFIILLALIVNLTLKAVGALLINALLIVPAATAGNLSRNLRQMFWLSLGLSLSSGILGALLASSIPLRDPMGGSRPLYFGWGGTIVVVSVLLFFVSMVIGPRLRGSRPA
jgi:zinc transport system permease protein